MHVQITGDKITFIDYWSASARVNTIAEHGGPRGSLAGVIGAGARVTVMQKVWRSLQAFGNIAFAYGFSIILLEIQARYYQLS